MSGAISLLPLYAFMALTGKTVPFSARLIDPMHSADAPLQPPNKVLTTSTRATVANLGKGVVQDPSLHRVTDNLRCVLHCHSTVRVLRLPQRFS
jgi:hypothetical protein